MINKKAQSVYVLIVILLVIMVTGVVCIYMAITNYYTLQCTVFNTPGGCFLIMIILGIGLLLYGGYECWCLIRGDYSIGKDIEVEE
jgi:hypothetical protein